MQSRYQKALPIAAVLVIGLSLSVYGYIFLKNGPFSPMNVPIAAYRNSRDLREHEEKRMAAILDGHEIDCVFAGFRRKTVFTRKSRAAEARSLLAHAVKDEGLRITLLEIKEGATNPVALTPYSVLEQEKAK